MPAAPPFSKEMEEYLLSCCMLDGSETIAKAWDAGVRPDSFFVPVNGIVYGKLHDLLERDHEPVAIEKLCEELKPLGLIDSVAEITKLIPTTAQEHYFIDRVMELHRRRRLLTFAAKIAEVEIELMALEITNLRVLSAEAENRAPGPEASILKIKGTEIQQAVTELLVQAAGPAARAFVDEVMEVGQQSGTTGPSYASGVAGNYFNMRKLSIYGGSNEIQKNIISQMILQL